MKMLAFAVDKEEIPIFEKYHDQYGIELTMTEEKPGFDNMYLAKGMDYYRDHKNQMVSHHEMAILNAMPNVLMLPHVAYFTDQAMEDMVHNSLIAAERLYRRNVL